MTMRSCTVVIAGAFLAGGARATEIRTAGMANVSGVVEDEATAFSLFNLGNAAGLGLLDKQNRVEWALGATGDTDERADSSTGSKLTQDGTLSGFTSPGGGYQGVTWWVTDADVIRLLGSAESASTKLTPAPPLPPPADQPQKSSATDNRIGLQYARKLGEALSLGLWLRPGFGKLTIPQEPGLTSQSTNYSLFDYNVGLAYRIPLDEGTAITVGANFQPYNDAPDLLALTSPLGFLAGAVSGFGGFKVKSTTVTDLQIKHTEEVTPAGTIGGFQATLNAKDRYEAVVAVDLTSAETSRTDVTDTRQAPPPIVPAEQTETGKASKLSRVRYLLGGRYSIPLSENSAIRTALTLQGQPATLDVLDFPNSTAVRQSVDSKPTLLTLGAAYHTKSGLTLGVGYDTFSDTQSSTIPLNPSASTTEIKPSAGIIRLGGEYWFNSNWAARAGYASRSSQTDDNDPITPAPGSDPSNPKRTDSVVSLGVGYKDGGLFVDGTLVFHSISRSPEPAPPQTETESAVEFKLGAGLVF